MLNPVLALLAIAVWIVMIGCGQQLDDDPATVTRLAPTPGLDSHVFPCGPPYWEPSIPYSDKFVEWTPDGSRLVFSHRTAIFVVDAFGAQLRMLVNANPGDYRFKYGFHADMSPDGRQVVFSACDYPWELQFLNAKISNALLTLPVYFPDDYDVALISIDGGAPQRLTDNPLLDHFPAWSPNGTRIAFIASIDKGEDPLSGYTLFTMAADGSNVQEVESTRFQIRVAAAPLVWSPDEEWLAFLVNEGGYGQGGVLKKNLFKVRPNGRELTLLAEDVVSAASWSPDGQRLTVAKYVGDGVGLLTLLDDGSGQKLIATITSRNAFLERHGLYQGLIRTVSWSPDGTQILYSCDNVVCTVYVADGRVTRLVEEVANWGGDQYVATWSPDGMRIALYTPGVPEYPNIDKYSIPPALFTVERDGTGRRDLIQLNDDGRLAPANPPREGS
ncbi:MAG: hypothetical protein OXK81_14515 [Chloroflexota bacterium]|nr:hypothetical protein [Chloroflexota bacterium]